MDEDQVTVGEGAIALIQNTAVNAANIAKLENLEGRPDFLVYREQGKFRLEVAPPIRRSHAFENLTSLVEFAAACINGKHGKGASPVVWYDQRSVHVCVDDAVRRDHGVLPLTLSPHINELLSGSSAKPRSQREFVKYLRINLAGVLPESSNLLSVVRNLRFGATSDGEGVIRHGEESMGKKITALVQGVDSIPEEVALTVRVYMTPDLLKKRLIRCAIDILTDEQAFRLVPLPCQIEQAIADEVEDIGANIESAVQCPVYRGRP